MKRLAVTALLLSLSLPGCTGEIPDEEAVEPEDMLTEDEGKYEAWNSANNPSYVDSTFLYLMHQLPVAGAGQVPVPGDYWAVAHDVLNVKWDGDKSQSPAEKWGKAFDRPQTMEKISAEHGVKNASSRQTCTSDSDCSSLKDGSICAKSFDQTVKRCIPTWWGICHGWAPHALSEPALRNPVNRTAPDGTTVTFYPGDLEGLMSLMYTQIPTKFISSRCNKNEPPTDAAGRLIDGECRDMNAGTWHIITTNLMGLRKQGFVIDQTYDDEVWNQPGWKYTITNAVDGKVPEITKDEAIGLLGLNLSSTAILPTTELAKDATRSGEYVAPAAGEITIKMTGTGDADLHVKLAAAPTTASYDCRPYGGSSIEECKVTVLAGQKVYWMILGYAATSSVQLAALGAGGSSAYTYNTSAARFYHVEMDFTFVVEGRPGRTTKVDDVESYAQTRHYSYIVEADANGKVLGGEWLDESRLTHPDFAWWPTAKPTASRAGGLITYAEVKALNDEAAGGATDAPAHLVALDNAKVTGASASSWTSKYGTFKVAAGYRSAKVTMTGSGDADLYVRKNSNPTVYTFNCKSVTAATSAESCTLNVSEGTYYVRARSKTANTTVSISADLSK